MDNGDHIFLHSHSITASFNLLFLKYLEIARIKLGFRQCSLFSSKVCYRIIFSKPLTLSQQNHFPCLYWIKWNLLFLECLPKTRGRQKWGIVIITKGTIKQGIITPRKPLEVYKGNTFIRPLNLKSYLSDIFQEYINALRKVSQNSWADTLVVSSTVLVLFAPSLLEDCSCL